MALATALLGPLRPAAAQTDSPPPLLAIEYSGLDRVDPALVEESVRISPGDAAYPFLITQSVRSLYALGLFDQVEAATSIDDSGRAVLTLRFSERPRVVEVVYEGNDHFNVDDLKEHGGPRAGGVLRRADLRRMAVAIEEAYREDGYPNTVVTPLVGEATGGREGVVVRVEIDEGQRLKIRQIAFAGNEAFTDDQLRGEIKTKPKGFLRRGRFQREKLEEDVERVAAFYRNNGFKDAQVRLQEPVFLPEDEGIQVTFTVEEGPRYYFGEPAFEGMTVLEEPAVRQTLPFLPGDPYDQSKIDETLANLYSMYTERGYLVELRIDPVTRVRGDTVAVAFRVREGEPSRVGDVKIVGNTRTKERVIRREIKLYPGDLLRRSRLLRSQRDIFATGYFKDVQLEYEPSPAPGEVDITFRVEEHSSATANGGVGYSSQIGLTGFVKFGHNNLFGNGQSLTLEIERGSRREYYDLSFTEPWVFGRPISAGIDLYNTENYREVYAGQSYDASYWHKVRGGGLRVGFPWVFEWPDYSRLTLGYSYSETRYRNYENLPQETVDLLLQGDGSRSRFFMSFHRNSTDNPFHPTLGTRSTLRSEFNGGLLGGEMDYYSVTLDHRQYFVPFWKPVLMLRWRFGVLGLYNQTDRMPPAERFRLGGITGFDLLRGYDDYYIVPDENVEVRDGREYRFPGGKTMFAFTSEIQFPLVDPVWGAFFMDAGNTWNSAYDISLSGLNLGVGAGITMEIPMIGPIGFYYGYGTETKRWRTHFAFGPQF